MQFLNKLYAGIKPLDLLFAVFLLLFAVMHVLSWSEEPPSVDPVNFLMALDHYEVATDRPHPTGYPLFVGLGRVASYFVGHAHAFQLVNLLMMLGGGLGLYLMMRRLNYPEVGLASAVLLLTHPLSLAATVVPESYFSDAFFGCIIAAWIVINAQRPKVLVSGITLIFLALGLFRAASGVELFPLALACVYVTTEKGQQYRRVFQVAVGAFVSIILAYVLTVFLAGGYQVYSAAVTRVMGAAVAGTSIFAGAPLDAHLFMLMRLTVWLLLISLPTLIVIALLWKARQKGVWPADLLKVLLVVLFWMTPPLAVYSLFYFLKPTYLIIFLPALLTIFSLGLFFRFRAHGQSYAWLIICVVVALQLGVFYGATKSWPKPLYQISQSYFNEQDTAWVELKAAAASADGKRSLLVWIEHPTLPVYALRLIPWSGKVAALYSTYEYKMKKIDLNTVQLQRIDPKIMQWSNAEKGVANFKDFDLIFVVTNENGRPNFKTYDIKTGNNVF